MCCRYIQNLLNFKLLIIYSNALFLKALSLLFTFEKKLMSFGYSLLVMLYLPSGICHIKEIYKNFSSTPVHSRWQQGILREHEMGLIQGQNIAIVGQFFVKIKKIRRAVLEGRWYTGKEIHQIWAEWAVHANYYLQNCLTNLFNFYTKLTYHSYILTLYKSHLVFTHYTLLPSVDRCDLANQYFLQCYILVQAQIK